MAIHTTFIANIGSASKKYALYRGTKRLCFAHLESENGSRVVTFDGSREREQRALSETEYQAGLEVVMGEFTKRTSVHIPDDISGVGFRIVAPGEYFQEHRMIDAPYLSALEDAKERAPLHLSPMLTELLMLFDLCKDVPIVGVSDSVFHRTLPSVASRYPIGEIEAKQANLRRFGYHGSSFSSIVRKLPGVLGAIPRLAVLCHLGSGVSITALRDGKSIDTSMGFSPLSGVPMATRSGDIDPSALLALLRRQGSTNDVEDYLYHRCGLLGMSGTTGDIRELFALEKKGDERASGALDAFAYGVKKYIGAYSAILGGLDAVVFSATIGERSAPMRSRICDGLAGLGIVLDKALNEQTTEQDRCISTPDSKVRIAVIRTDELGEIAFETARVLTS